MRLLGEMRKIKAALEAVRGKSLSIAERKQAAIDLAALLLKQSLHIQTSQERSYQKKLARLVRDPASKIFAMTMTDQCFRSSDPVRTADQLTYLLHTHGIPACFTWSQRLGLKAFKHLAPYFPHFSMSVVKKLIRQQTSRVILPAEAIPLAKHLVKRRKEGITVNLNHLGEAILGEEEALDRLSIYLEDLSNPSIDYISVKISSIFSQLNLIDYSHTLQVLKERLRALYRTALQHSITDLHGSKRSKFVNLDMEEYRDLHMTIDLFKEVLDEQEFLHVSAGIVLQSYLPDSFAMQQKLTEWAIHRIDKGGAPIKIRLVKGANLAMEQVEASLRNWPQAPYLTKKEVDANFKRMMLYGSAPEHARAVHIGIGSHNLFDIAFGLLLCAEREVERWVNFEMLEGMAGATQRVVQALSSEMVLYCPIASEEELQYAIAYLIRRLDENTAPENFLRHIFGMVPGSLEWEKQAELFSQSCESIDDQLLLVPRRQQNRLEEPLKINPETPFCNEPDTDWSLPQNRQWAEKIWADWRQRIFEPIPLIINGQAEFDTFSQASGDDPSDSGKSLYFYALANPQHIDKALEAASTSHIRWSAREPEERSFLLAEVANQLRCARADLIGAMMADTGKTLSEADIEVSEAIDFAEYYRRNAEEITALHDIQWHSKGVILVAPPWNFPCSIPAGGILAALAAGNSVLFKPAPEAVLVGWTLAQAFWKGGIPKDLLQFIPCEDDATGSLLVQDHRVNCIILTGSTVTAKLFLRMRPQLDLAAETGGKNALIITRLADRDLAIKDLIQSAFGHSGQKCSACSLAICEAEVYDSPSFRQALRDAAESLPVGNQWNLSTKINPLIRFPSTTLLRGLTRLDEGEEWLLRPVQDTEHTNLWSPGIKMGVKPGSFSHLNEFFGPVLSLMRADDLEHAIEIANGTPYGLTSGLHSLDEREQKIWAETIQAGNRYINRGITGAIVQRQPFGGWKQSSFGRGSKAGGPNYVLQFMHATQIVLPNEHGNSNPAAEVLSPFLEKEVSQEDLLIWNASLSNYAFFWTNYFSKKHDHSSLLGQDNFLFYLPIRQQTLRRQEGDKSLDLLRVAAGALTCGATLEISIDPGSLQSWNRDDWASFMPHITLIEETEPQLIERIGKGCIQRLRTLQTPSAQLAQAMAEAGQTCLYAPVLANGRVELLLHLHEASLSMDTHRYGNLIPDTR